MPAPDFSGVVVAAGRSSRFGGAIPKPFLSLAGRTVLERSVRCLSERPSVRGVVVVLAPEELEGARGRQVRDWPGVVRVVAGGASRAESVRNGVLAIETDPFVLVHDAARPLAPAHVVDAVVAATREHGAAVPVLPLADTVKRIDGRWVAETVDRDTLRRAQTPQGARTEWLHDALERALARGVVLTDESAVLEEAGKKVATVDGDSRNLKITTPADLQDAERRLGRPPGDLRVGTGYDVHRCDPQRKLVLGGVTFDGVPGLAGHSDADVVLHAAMDALLGAAALGDIGAHFPPGEARWKDADSRDLARSVAGLLQDQGYEIVNLDLTVLAEAPRIAPRAEEMRRSIAACLGTEPERVGLKATTLETLGALGRGEGIACQASALIRRRGR